MAGSKFLQMVNGFLTEIRGQQTSAGVADGGKVVALDDTGKLDSSLMPVGFGDDAITLPATEALNAGDFVNIWNSGGAKVRKADASSLGKRAHGFVTAGVLNGGDATVHFEGHVAGLAGLTPGAAMFLSATTPGGVTNDPPDAGGNIVQGLGIAISATEINAEIEQPVVLAA